MLALKPCRFVLFGLLILTATACKKKATPLECDALLDRFSVLAAQESVPDASTEEVRAAQKQAHDEAADDEDFRACAGRVTHDEMTCAMAAPNADAFERCLQ
ncbi:MAG: hypothetical protein ABI461_04685 [Polyangiaceae bacterium]